MKLQEEEFFNHQALEDCPNAYRYAILFAQDCDPTAIYAEQRGDQPTDTFSALALAVGRITENRRQGYEAQAREFYAGAFVERAATYYNDHPTATLEEMLFAGQTESDAIAA